MTKSLLIDTNGWIQKVEGVKDKENMLKFKDIFEAKKYKIILNELTLYEFAKVVEEKRSLKRQQRFYIRRFVDIIETLDHEYLKMKRHVSEYFAKSYDLYNKTKLKNYKDIHRHDLEPLILLREYKVKEFTVFTGDLPFAKALEKKDVLNILKDNGIIIDKVITFNRNKEN